MTAADRFPRASTYDPNLVFAGAMGPNPLWLCEWLCSELGLEPGMRVLDLGCGRALTSVYLAREHAVSVWAADLWVKPTENWERLQAAGVADRVTPLQLEAHSLPFAEGFFDAIVSIDAYHYFGTDELYLQYLCRFLRPGGRLGVVIPGLTRELSDGVPKHLAEPQSNGVAFWEPECISFHSPAWWRSLWERSGRVKLERADLLPDGCALWAEWERSYSASGHNPFPSVQEALEKDGGDWIGFVRLVAERAPEVGMDLYRAGMV